MKIRISAFRKPSIQLSHFGRFYFIDEDGEGPAVPEARTSTGEKQAGIAVGVTIFVVVVLVAIAIACFAYRGRIKSFVHRCSQQVTEMSYKKHDVAFVNEDKCESVNIPSFMKDENQETGSNGGTSSTSAHYHVNI